MESKLSLLHLCAFSEGFSLKFCFPKQSKERKELFSLDAVLFCSQWKRKYRKREYSAALIVIHFNVIVPA